MATKQQVKNRLVLPRLQSRHKFATWAEFAQAMQAADSKMKAKVLAAVNERRPTQLGRFILKATDPAKAAAVDARADQILADDAISLTEIDELL